MLGLHEKTKESKLKGTATRVSSKAELRRNGSGVPARSGSELNSGMRKRDGGAQDVRG